MTNIKQITMRPIKIETVKSPSRKSIQKNIDYSGTKMRRLF